MEQRTREILKLLLQAEKFLTTAEIAKSLGVSSKTISRQMPKVEEILLGAGLELEKKSGAGILVTGSDVKKYLLAEKIKTTKKRDYSAAERKSIIIGRLLTSREPVKLFALSHGLFVTDATISNDLDKLENWFTEKNLKLLRKPGLGVSLLGNERDLRRAIVKYIYEHIGENELLNLIQDNLTGENSHVAQISNFLLDLIDAGDLRKFEKILQDFEREADYKFSDNAFIGLTVHLALVVQRIKNHEPVELDAENILQLRQTKEFLLAKNLAEKISAIFEIEVPEQEIFYITAHILGARLRQKISMTDNFKIVRMARQIMKSAAKISGQSIDKNQNLLEGLINHLTPTLSRIKMQMEIRNPLLGEMQAHYPELLTLTEKSVAEVETELQIKFPAAEIAYLAMHIGAALSDTEKFSHARHRVVVACPTGMGTSRLLASRLKKTFPTLKIVDEVPILKITPEYVAEKDFEFIISTAPINKISVPVVLVGATLSDDDKIKIDAEISRQNKIFLQTAEALDKQKNFTEILQQLTSIGATILSLTKNYFFRREVAENINDVCKLAGELAGENSQEKIEIANDLLIREDKGGTVLAGQNMVLLHAKSNFVTQPTFGIIQLGDGFIYNGEKIKTAIVLLAPVNADEFAIETIGHIASVLLDRWGFIEILHEGDGEEIFGEMQRIFEDFYKTKLSELI